METHQPPRKPYLSDVTDEEWAFVAPYLTLMDDRAPQRRHGLREVFNGLRFIVRGGLQWRLMPHDLPPWDIVYQQTRRWMDAGSFEAIVHDLRTLLRLAAGRAPERAGVHPPPGLLVDDVPGRAGYDGAKRRKGSKTHVAVDTLGHLLALHVTPADEGDRAQVAELAAAVQEATGQRVE